MDGATVGTVVAIGRVTTKAARISAVAAAVEDPLRAGSTIVLAPFTSCPRASALPLPLGKFVNGVYASQGVTTTFGPPSRVSRENFHTWLH